MRYAVAVFALFLAGCGVSAKTFRTGTGTLYPPTRPEAVLVFFSAEEVPRPFDVIAEIMLEASSGWGNHDSDLVVKAQQTAGRVGAQGIIVAKEKGASTGMAQFFGANDKVQRVRAIRFTDGK